MSEHRVLVVCWCVFSLSIVVALFCVALIWWGVWRVGAVLAFLAMVVVTPFVWDYVRREHRRHVEVKSAAHEASEQGQRERTCAYLRELASVERMLKMESYEFEKFVVKYYCALGFRGHVTQATADEGVDGILHRGGEHYVLQCKRFGEGTVGQPAVRDLLGTVTKRGATGGILVTTSQFTAKARSFAEETVIELIDGEEFVRRIRDLCHKGGVRAPFKREGCDT